MGLAVTYYLQGWGMKDIKRLTGYKKEVVYEEIYTYLLLNGGALCVAKRDKL